MKIGLIDVDGHNYPNLALMKLSAYHKSINNSVEWYTPFNEYDIVYKAKVFTFTPDYPNYINNSNTVINGGTGYDYTTTLPIDNIQPDYSLYPISKWYDNKTAYGFITRGCIRKCKWCLVPNKEGDIRPYMSIEEIIQDKKQAILMDNNILASDFGIKQIERIIDLKIKVDFNQGLDSRIVLNNKDIIKLLFKVQWLRYIRLACDSMAMIDIINRTVNELRFNNFKKKIFCYVLLNDLQDSYDRLIFCKSIKITPFAQPYRDFTPNQIIPQWQSDMARWCNHKAIFETTDFMDYEPRKGFKCREYFK